MGTGRMRIAGGKAAPEVHDRRIVAYLGAVDQLVLQSRVSVNRFMYRAMQRNDLIDASHVMPEPIYECRIYMEQRAK